MLRSRFLNYVEYLGLGFAPLDNENDFDHFLRRASYVLHHVTRNFYKFNDFENDFEWRKDAFKKALGAQIEFFNEMGAVTYESINNEPQTQQIGRTSITKTSRFNPHGGINSRQILAADAYLFLQGTGLLWRGGLG